MQRSHNASYGAVVGEDEISGLKRVLLFGSLLLLAFLPRFIMALNTPVIAVDGVGYIEAARGGDEAAAAARLPCYPLAIRFLDRQVGDPVLAGKIVSVVMGTVFALFMGLLARRVLPAGCAWIAFLLAAFQPYLIRYSGDVLTEPLYLALMALLYLLAWESMERPGHAPLAGGVAALMCLTRPESALFVAMLLLGMALTRGPMKTAADSAATDQQVAGPGTRWISMGLFVLVLAAALVPAYLAGTFTAETSDTLAKTYFEKLAKMEGTQPPEDPPSLPDFALNEPGRFAKKTVLGMGEALVELVQALHPLVFLLSLFGFWFMYNRRKRYALQPLLLFPALALFLFFAAVYPSKRYMLQSAIPFLLWAALGIHAIEKIVPRGRRAAVAVLVLTCILCQFKAGVSQREDKRYLRETGELIAEMSKGLLPVVITDSVRISFYAGGRRFDPDWLRDQGVPLQRKELRALLGDVRQEAVFFYIKAPGQPLPDSALIDPQIRVIDLPR
jgi:hypothetical protein